MLELEQNEVVYERVHMYCIWCIYPTRSDKPAMFSRALRRGRRLSAFWTINGKLAVMRLVAVGALVGEFPHSLRHLRTAFYARFKRWSIAHAPVSRAVFLKAPQGTLPDTSVHDNPARAPSLPR
jgi:hypothetical protein